MMIQSKKTHRFRHAKLPPNLFATWIEESGYRKMTLRYVCVIIFRNFLVSSKG